MKSRPIILCTFLFVAVTETQSDSTPKEDLQDEYYTVIDLKSTGPRTPSDVRDAQAVLDSNKDEKVMASIFAYRDKIRRRRISKTIYSKNLAIAYKLPTESEQEARLKYWFTKEYVPSSTAVSFTDFLYALIIEEDFVLSGYLSKFFEQKSEKLINIAMVLTKDMASMIAAYDFNSNISGDFKDARKSQNGIYEHMLRVWVRNNREPLEKEDPTADVVKNNAEALNKEQDKCGWQKTRDRLEMILMKKSIKFSRLVIQEFEKLNKGGAIEDILTNNVKTCGLDDKLADAYATLARYIKNKHNCIARILGPQCDGSVSFYAWVLSIAVVHPQEWPQINEVFKKEQKGVSLSKFITEKITYDKVLAESMAVIVDPMFKPTLFRERPLDNSPLPPPLSKP